MAFRMIQDQEGASEGPSLIQRAGKSLLRGPALAAKELGATTAGFPGDILNLLNMGIANPVAGALGFKPEDYGETALGKALPTTATLRSGIEKDVSFTKPQNRGEEFFGDFISDATALLIGGSRGNIPFKNSITRAIGISAGSNALGKLVEDFTGDSSVGGSVKMGSMMAMSLLSRPSAQKAIGELYSKAESAIPQGASVDASRLTKDIVARQNKLLAGRPVSALSPSEKFVYDEGQKILSSVGEEGDVGVKTLWALKRALNEQLQGLYQTLQKGARKSAKALAKPYTADLRRELEGYGKKNPQFLEPFKDAEKGFGVLASSNFISNWIRENIHPSLAHPALLKLFGGAAKLALPYEAVKVGYRALKSPAIRKHYGNVIKSAAKEDAVAMNREVAKMQHEIEKDNKKSKSKYRLVD